MGERGFFDQFADRASTFVSHAPFFAGCVLLIVLWVPSILIFRDIDTWQLVVNTGTTIITFLLVALLQNSQQRFENSVHLKLNALTVGLGDLMEAMAGHIDENRSEALIEDARELRDAAGAERTVGA